MANIVEYDTHYDVQTPDGNVERHNFYTKSKNIQSLDALTGRQRALFELLAKNPYIEADNGDIYRMGVQIVSTVNDDGNPVIVPDLYLEIVSDSSIKEKMSNLETAIMEIFGKDLEEYADSNTPNISES